MLEFQEISAKDGSASGGKNRAEYNPFLISKDAPFTQAWFFGEWQEAMGRRVRRFEIKNNAEIFGFFQLIKYPVPFGQSFLYIPHGPILRQGYGEHAGFFESFRDKLSEIGKEESAIFIRFDLFPKTEENLSKYFEKVLPHAYHSSCFQPKFEWILNLEKPEEEILSGMRPKTRYNINLAENKGVKIKISNDLNAYFADFYKLLKETAGRNKFGIHPELYYRNVFENCKQNKNAFLVIARRYNAILAANLILLSGKTAYFLYGGSSNELKNLMAPHLTHWEAIKEAKNRRLKFYNFGATDPSTLLETSSFKGISRFKKGFGGKILAYSDSYDLVLKPLRYKLYGFAKSIRQTL